METGHLDGPPTSQRILAVLKDANIDRRSGWPGYAKAKKLFEDIGLSCTEFERTTLVIARFLKV
jgi:hypothetical protein